MTLQAARRRAVRQVPLPAWHASTGCVRHLSISLALTALIMLLVRRVSMQGLASGYAMGTIPSFRSATLWPTADPDAPKLEATVKKWVDFFKNHRLLFAAGNMLHVRRPDSRGYEAVAFVQPGSYSILSGKSLLISRKGKSRRTASWELARR